MRVLLDTCAILWAVGAPQRLSARARTVLKEPETEVFVLAISAAEITCACERRRIALDRHWKTWFRTDWQADNHPSSRLAQKLMGAEFVEP